ncbi:cbb3-type cytochrome oxidase subunit 3 [Pseudomaricurvus sp.]|uniref:cbb3-type cytochrome oxidase subunit 3 n=1 Tax=Pseudomaricurvus sp. TaxID=2004510 RepID=UPI003F6BC68E
MDINDFRSLSTVLVFIAFIGVCWWAFSPSRKKKFDDAANLPFSDDEINNLESSKKASGDDKKKQD